ncbi:ABC transporter permease [Sporosarcina thermotolerans]|uniref:ABC transporter permease n=1 Tax=Sporosarcina thermotolerans TaxID=633404 RepID=A0AAW9A9U4_9BACL|nr:ABC transporter permease [Sporosarcina thermotolerans]MDW0118157.1 ABC transporter permease [Sporosarcina thermotolerans]WHT47646.1 ABC transporter permease [Sporosarcina thermotolerans]
MFYYIKATLRERWPIFLVVMLILSCLGMGYVGAQSVSERMVIQTKDDLDKNWRYQYDILVLPELSDQTKGLDDGWIAPQASLSSYGGISLEDLEVIRKIPGVQVAAPLSHIGYVEVFSMLASYQDDKEGDYSYVEHSAVAFDGLSDITISESNRINEYSAYYGGSPVGFDPEKYSHLSNKLSEENSGWKTFMPAGTNLRQPNYLMLIAIDPEAEEQLFTLSDSLVIGNSLQEAEIGNSGSARLIPIIALADGQAKMTETLRISRIHVPEDVDESDFIDGATEYLLNLPRTEVVNLSLDTFSEQWKYKYGELSLLGKDQVRLKSGGIAASSEALLYRFTPIQFESNGKTDTGIPLMKALTVKNTDPYDIRTINLYRGEAEEYRSVGYGLKIIDLYDSTKIVPKFKGTWKDGDPADVYTPHHSMIIEDGAGNKINPTPLFPLPYKDTYYTGSPDAITTIEAASIFYSPEDILSSIRVVVEGVEERTDSSQHKVEAVAKQIMDLTGHHVEIMLGSSSSKVHVDLDTDKEGVAGVVEEGWQQAGVSWSIQEHIEKSNIILFFYLLLVSFVFCYTVITHSLLRRSTEFAMLRAIGWSRRKIVGILTFEIITLSVFALIPIAVANIWLKILPSYEFFIIFLIVIPIIAIGYVTGSRKALKLSPRAGLEGEGTQWSFMRLFKINGLLSYVVHQLIRRPLRFGLLAIVLALTAFMSILFVATQQSLSDFLLLSFLGETIDLNLKGFQTAFLVVGLILTIAIVFLLLFLNITERKKEFFILRSVGWSLRRIQMYLSVEVTLIALLGSVIGAIGAYLLLTIFSSLWIPVWMLVLIIVMPVVLLLGFSLAIVQSMKMSGVVKDQHAA